MRTSNSGSRYASGGRLAERDDGGRPAGLQPELDAVQVFERGERDRVVARERLEDAQHERVDERNTVVVGDFADRDLDLRQAVADRQARRSASRRRGSSVESLRGTTWHSRHVRDEARLALVEPDEHAALLHDVTHRQPRAIAVFPRGTLDRRQHDLRTHAADARERVLERALLRGDLQRRMRVLQRAAAAHAEVRASRGRRATRSPCGCSRRAQRRSSAFRATVTASTRSPGSAPSTNVALPSTWATPRPSWSSDSMTTSARLMRACIGYDARALYRRHRPARGKIRAMKLLAFDTSTQWLTVACLRRRRDGSSATSSRDRRIRSACCRSSTRCSPRPGSALARPRRHRLRRGPRLVHRRAHRAAASRRASRSARASRSCPCRRSRRSRSRRGRRMVDARARVPRRAHARGLRGRLPSRGRSLGRRARARGHATGRRRRHRPPQSMARATALPRIPTWPRSSRSRAWTQAPSPGRARSPRSRCRESPPGAPFPRPMRCLCTFAIASH